MNTNLPLGKRLALLRLLACACLLAAQSALAGISGMPLYQHFGPEDYAAAPLHLALEIGDDGSLFVGNVEGVLRYDGSSWTLIQLPGRGVARTLLQDGVNRLYVGGRDEFGYLSREPNGDYVYHSLLEAFAVDTHQHPPGNVWSIQRADSAVYFHSDRRLFRLSDDGSKNSWPVTQDVRGAMAANDRLYSRVEGIGLCRFEDGEFQPVAGSDEFAEKALNALIPRDDGVLLVGPDSFYLADDRGIHKQQGDAQRIFADAVPYVAIALPDGSIVIGTLAGELLLFDRDLAFVSRTPIGPYSLLDLQPDHEGGLWLASEGDLLRLRVPSPWSSYGSADGIPGTITDTAWMDDRLWVANSRGVAVSESDERGRVRFKQILSTRLETYDLQTVDDGLLVAEREGLWWLPQGSVQDKRRVSDGAVYTMLRSTHDGNIVFAAAQDALLRLRRQPDGWSEVARWPTNGIDVSTILEGDPGELWLGDSRDGVQRWRLSDSGLEVAEKQRFGPDQGLMLKDNFGSYLQELDGQLLANSGGRISKLDGNRFVPFSGPPASLLQRPDEMEIEETPFGTYASTSRELLRRAPGSSDWEPVQLPSRQARGYSGLHMDDDGRLRVATWNGLLQYNGSEAPIANVQQQPLRVALARIERRTGDGNSQSLPLDTEGEVSFPPDSNLRLSFSLITMESGAEVRWRLPGRVIGWSDWAPVADSALSFGRVDSGEYRLEVEGRVPSGRPVESLHYDFRGEPRWYLRWPVIVAGCLLVLGLIGVIVQLVARWRYRHMLQINRRLEQKITERTQELESANARLAELATEDSLTGVANRRALELALNREWQRCAESQSPLSVIMIDVDHFKRYNDAHGHLQGDRQLRWVAEQLASNSQPVRELVARFGGEEFVLVLPRTTADRAMQRGELLRRRFSESDSGLTISVGVATEIPRLGDDPARLLQRADTALYRAKHRGRNRVELAED